MTAYAPACDREAELAAIRPVALAGIEVKPGSAQPGDRQTLQRMTNGKDAQRLAGEILVIVLGRRRELELQGAFTSMSLVATASERGTALHRAMRVLLLRPDLRPRLSAATGFDEE